MTGFLVVEHVLMLTVLFASPIKPTRPLVRMPQLSLAWAVKPVMSQRRSFLDLVADAARDGVVPTRFRYRTVDNVPGPTSDGSESKESATAEVGAGIWEEGIVYTGIFRQRTILARRRIVF